MATTGILDGTTLLLFVDGVAIGGTTSHSMSNSVNMRDATTKDSGGDEEVLPGTRSSNIDFEGFAAFDATKGFTDLFDLQKAKTKVILKFSGEVTGDDYFIANAFLESLDTDAPVDDNVTFSGSFHVTGGVRRKTFT